jgi:hypothetical protein
MIQALGPWLMEGCRVYCLDGGNVFNPLPLARWLAGQGGRSGQIMEERLFVSRAYTCHQLAGAARTMLALLASEQAPPVLALITGIETLFLDEDIPLFERRYLFQRVLAEARALGERGLPVLITYASGPPNPWVEQLARSARMLKENGALLPMLRGAG